MKKIFTILTMGVFCLCVFTGNASAQTSGTTGDCTWTLTGEGDNLTLTISGTGAMEDYIFYEGAPWYSNRENIKTVVVEDGVTTIGSYAFYWCSGLTSVSIPNSVTTIGESAFENCYGLTSVSIPNSVTSIGNRAFYNCSGLTSVSIPNSVTTIGDNAFSYCSGLTSVSIPNSVTTIGDRAFYYCSGLTSVTIPNSVTSIGDYAFSDCIGLTGTLTIPESVTTIGEGAFYNCSGLTSVSISNSVVSIGRGAFYECSGLTAIYVDAANPNYCSEDGILFNKTKTELIVYPGDKQGEYTIPNSVISIGDYAFNDCSGLTSVTIPNSVTSIGDYAFVRCSGLTSITIPNSVTSIGDYAFSGCSGLTSVSVPNSVTAIGEQVFYGCSGLTSVSISNSVVSIGRGAFYECSGLTSVSIPNSVTSIGDYAFWGCSGLTSVTIPNSVTSIGNYAFANCRGLTDVTVYWATPLAIGSSVFYDVTVSNVTLHVPSGTKALYQSADVWKDFGTIEEAVGQATTFTVDGINYKVTGANTVEVGDNRNYSGSAVIPEQVTDNGTAYSVTAIAGRAFNNCWGLTNVSIPNSVTEIGFMAFVDCGSLVSITIPSSVTSMGMAPFTGCANLVSITVDSNNSNYADEDGILFNKSRTSILCYPAKKTGNTYVIPNSVTSIGDRAFSECVNLDSVIIPNSITSIEMYTFGYCSNLTSVKIGSSVISIGDMAFGYCNSLSSITCLAATPPKLGGSDVYYGVSQSACTLTVPAGSKAAYQTANTWKNFGSIEEQNVPQPESFAFDGIKYDVNGNNTVEVGDNRNYSGSAVIPEQVTYNGTAYSVTAIGGEAFFECSGLTSVSIPNSVTTIGKTAFDSCIGLTSVSIGNSVTTISASAFENCYGLTSVTIPNSVTSIGYFAFSNCIGLQTVTVNWNTPLNVLSNIFNGTNIGDCTLKVPAGSAAAYQTAGVWKYFGTITDENGQAAAFTVDGINYNVTGDNTVEVGDNGNYSGSAVIPEQVTYNGTAYSVTSIGRLAFNDCSGLTSVTIPNSVTRIGDMAFYYCRGLTSVSIPNSVTRIGERAFSGCSGLTSVSIGNSVTSIGDYAFYNCGLTSVAIPNSVTSIGEAAFYYCIGLTSVAIPNSVTSIGEAAFANCSGLTSVSIGNSVTSIGGDAFYSCRGLTAIYVDAANPNYCSEDGILFNKTKTELIVYPGGKQGEYTIPNSVTTISDVAFSFCRGLTSVSIPNSVRSIGGWAFESCSGLTSVSIPNSVTSIGDYAFIQCSGLTSVSVPNSVTSIGEGTFSECSSLTDVTVYWATPLAIGSSVFQSVTVSNVTLHVPSGTTALYQAADVWKDFGTITEMTSSGPCEIPTASGAFGENNALTWTLCPDGTFTVSGTGDMPDYDNVHHRPWHSYLSSIRTVTVNDGVTGIGKYAFYGCPGLTSVSVPASVTGIGESALSSSGLTSIDVAGGNTVYASEGGVLFNKAKTELIICPQGKSGSYAIPNSVITVRTGAFAESGLASITIPSGVTGIGESVFTGCSELTSINVASGNTVYASEDGVLFNKAKTELIECPSGKSGNYTVPGSVTVIGDIAFSGCSGLASITVSGSVTSIGYGAFWYCTGLTSITIPNSVTSIGSSAFNYCSSLTSVTIPNSITSINRAVFQNSGLTSIIIPNSVTVIGDYAISGCRELTSVTIPESVTSIGDYAFWNCTGLASVTVNCAVPLSINSKVFESVNTANVRLVVPAGTKSLYEAADVWKDFTITEQTSTGTDASFYNLETDGGINLNNSKLAVMEMPFSDRYLSYATPEGENFRVAVKSVSQTVTPDYLTVYPAVKRSLSVGGVPVEIPYYVFAASINDEKYFLNVGETRSVYWSKLTSSQTAQLMDSENNPDMFPTYKFCLPKSGAQSVYLQTLDIPGDAPYLLRVGASTLFVSCGKLDEVVASYTGDICAVDYTDSNIASALTAWSLVAAPPIVAVTGVSLDKTAAHLLIGQTGQLTATVLPDNAANKNLTWSSSNETVATVSATGLITAKAQGTAAITVTTEDGGYTDFCSVTVEKNQTVVIEENKPAGENGTGRFDLSLTIPANTLFTGSFTLTLPAGFHLNVQETGLSGELSNSLTLNLTQNADGSWLFTISGNALRSSTESVYQKIVDIVYTIDESLDNGQYEVTVNDLSLDFEDGTHIVEPEIVASVTVDHSYVGIQYPNPATLIVQMRDNYLYVNTSVEEYIQIYSVTGQLLYSQKKAAGEITIALPLTKRQMIIVKGSSGWVKKVM